MRRATIGLFALVLVAGTALGATGTSGAESGSGTGSDEVFIRWDLSQFVGNVIVVGGTDVSTDAESGDTIELTGSGHAEPLEAEAAGGGTFVHETAEGETVAEGAYYVTGFRHWRLLTGGSLDETGLIDGIGNGPGANPNEHEPTSGVLRLKVRFVPVEEGTPQPGVNGILIIFCHLPGTTVFVQEGVEVKIPSFGLDFKQTSGVTLFHRLR
jgi:hypothetical protein